MNRKKIIQKNHILDVPMLLSELSLRGKLFYQGNHSYVEGHEHLLTNEFDFSKTQFSPAQCDVVFGFSTNSLWDLALSNQSNLIISADWSPWPIIAQALICEPLIRIAKSPQELIFMVSGIPSRHADGFSLENAFKKAKEFTLSKISDQKEIVLELLLQLAEAEDVSDLELKFLTTFFRPRIGDNLNGQSGYGSFPKLKSANVANLTFYLEGRYNRLPLLNESTVFSSIANFEYLKALILGNKIVYALADVMDAEFYLAVARLSNASVPKSYALSISNLFECGYYNNLSLQNLEILKTQVKTIFQNKVLYLYQTLNRTIPYRYLRDKIL